MKTRYLIGPILPAVGFCAWAMLYGSASPYANAMTCAVLAWAVASTVFLFWMTAREALQEQERSRREYIEEFGQSPSEFMQYDGHELVGDPS